MKVCDECGAKVKDENLRKHYTKVHPTLERKINKLPRTPRAKPAPMTKSGKRLATIVTIVVFAIVALIILSTQLGSQNTGPKYGQLAPDFTLTTTDGNSVTLSSYRGKVVLLEFMDVDCPYCKEEAPVLASLHTNHTAVQFLSIDMNFEPPTDTIDRINAYRVQYGNPWPFMLDNGIAPKYGVTGTPTIFIIGSDGTVKWSDTGFVEYSTLAAQL